MDWRHPQFWRLRQHESNRTAQPTGRPFRANSMSYPLTVVPPILNIVVPHSPHLPRVANRPFFSVTSSDSCISRCARHFRQYPLIVNSFLIGSSSLILVP